MTEIQTIYEDYVQQYGHPPKQPDVLIVHAKNFNVTLDLVKAQEIIKINLKGKSSAKQKNKSDTSVSSSFNHKYPVCPLILPNNCFYDKDTNTMTVNHDIPRETLVIYKPALQFIRNIRSKVATISITGRSRTGKSFIASELYAPQTIPCPFSVGHNMDACTYGIWVSVKPIKHPNKNDTVILIFDVEGSGFYENNKHNDMQLMVITLLISSYFIYNTKDIFDVYALNEIKFLLDLTKHIHSTPANKNGNDFHKHFPVFMWLLRDIHLEPTIESKHVSILQYFTDKVLKVEQGLSPQIQQRQYIRNALCQMFKKYDVFTLQIPSENKQILKQISNIPRSKLQPAFNDNLKLFYDIVMKDTMVKSLFHHVNDKEDKYVECTGTHLALWIETCVKSINDPNKIPTISLMTKNIITMMDKQKQTKIIKKYKCEMHSQLNKLKNDTNMSVLNEKDINKIHLKIMRTFDITNNKEICNQIQNIFKKILNENQKLSEKECNDFTETA
eukprot:548472_1